MRLQKITATLILVVMFMTSAMANFGQTTKGQIAKNTGGSTVTCSCPQSDSENQRTKNGTVRRNRNQRSKKRTNVAQKPTVRKIAKKKITKKKRTPPPAPVITVTSIDFADIKINASEESKIAGIITLSDGSENTSDYQKYLSVQPQQGNLQAWIAQDGLHVFSPTGGAGRVIITDKAGNYLDTVTVTANPLPPSSAETTMKALGEHAATLANTINQMWWMLGVGLLAIIILLIILLLVVFFRLGSISNRVTAIDTRLTNMDEDLQDLAQRYNIPLRVRPVVVNNNAKAAAQPDITGRNQPLREDTQI